MRNSFVQSLLKSSCVYFCWESNIISTSTLQTGPQSSKRSNELNQQSIRVWNSKRFPNNKTLSSICSSRTSTSFWSRINARSATRNKNKTRNPKLSLSQSLLPKRNIENPFSKRLGSQQTVAKRNIKSTNLWAMSWESILKKFSTCSTKSFCRLKR